MNQDLVQQANFLRVKLKTAYGSSTRYFITYVGRDRYWLGEK